MVTPRLEMHRHPSPDEEPLALKPGDRSASGPLSYGQLFGARLKAGRKSRGRSQAQLSAETGVTAAYISSIERGIANPTLETMMTLGDAVGCEVWQMIAAQPAVSAIVDDR